MRGLGLGQEKLLEEGCLWPAPHVAQGEGDGGAGVEATRSLLLGLCLQGGTPGLGLDRPPPSFFARSLCLPLVWPAFLSNSLFVSPGPIREEPGYPSPGLRSRTFSLLLLTQPHIQSPAPPRSVRTAGGPTLDGGC